MLLVTDPYSGHFVRQASKAIANKDKCHKVAKAQAQHMLLDTPCHEGVIHCIASTPRKGSSHCKHTK
jgi:hypothetical protein